MRIYVLDTSIVSRILRRDADVLDGLETATSVNSRMILCPVVHYEILRGFRKTHSPRLSKEFDELSSYVFWDDMRRSDWEKAAELWASAVAKGHPHEDADVLIAGFAASRSATLVTANEKHFQGLGIPIENWTKP
jgi:predicted nucleic acid-binding protein